MKLIGVTLRPKTDEHNNIMFVSFRPQSYLNELYPILWDKILRYAIFVLMSIISSKPKY